MRLFHGPFLAAGLPPGRFLPFARPTGGICRGISCRGGSGYCGDKSKIPYIARHIDERYHCHHIIGTTGGHGIVARILIRNLDGTTIERLKFRAAQNGRSLQAEVEDLPQIGGGTYMPKDFDYWPLA
jgi:hypothetical protein